MKPAVFVLAALLFTLPAVSGAAEKYAVPDILKAKLIQAEKQFIKDREPSTEIEIRTYKGSDGWLFRSYGVGGYIFRYDVSENGELPYRYRLIDSDGDGTFETKEMLTGEAEVKGKGGRYYVDLGPEPGKEYKYSWMEVKPPGMREESQILMGLPIYIPQWVILRFK